MDEDVEEDLLAIKLSKDIKSNRKDNHVTPPEEVPMRDDGDEDPLLAIKLSEEIESRHSSQSTPAKQSDYSEFTSGDTPPMDDADEDLLLAIKLSEEIESRHSSQNTPAKQSDYSELTSGDTPPMDDADEDLLLAIKLSEEIESRHSSQNTPVKQSNHSELTLGDTTPMDDADEDLLLAIKLSEEIESRHSQQNTDLLLAIKLSKQSEALAHQNKPKRNDLESFLKDMETDEDLFLAIKLSKEIESQALRKETLQPDDFEYALKLSQQLNCGPSMPTTSQFKPKDDYLSTVPIVDTSSETEVIDLDVDEAAQNVAAVTARHTNKDFMSRNYENDYLLAVQLSMDSETKVIDDDDVHVQAVKSTQIINSVTPSSDKSKRKSEHTHKYMDKTLSVVDPSWETIDPNPDIYALFIAFNKRFFWGRLDMVEVKWSPRMTSCAGICSYRSRAGHCIVSLSKPLLQYRPRKDLVETLLHEMIHAYLFVTKNNRDRDGHGPQFHEHMYRINRESGSHITVYHSFHDEVRLYKVHWWKCDGPCQQRPPYYGMVKRSMNRAPGPYDQWWNDHRATCGGTFNKVKEPENFGKKKSEKAKKAEADKSGKKTNIADFFNRPSSSSQPNGATGRDSASSSTAKPLSNFGSGRLIDAGDLPRFGRPTTSSVGVRDSVGTSSQAAAGSTKPAPAFSSGKIVTLADLSKKLNQRSPNKTPPKSPKKWVPLPGQRNILQFMNKS